MPPRTELPFFAACAPGLEPLVLTELRALGVAGARAEQGGVGFAGGDRALHRANLWLRTASRVVVRAARFHAAAFHELERQAQKVAWEQWLAPGAPVRFRVTCRKSKLYHSDAVAERLVRSVARRLGEMPALVAAEGDEGDDEGESSDGAQLVVARLVHDELTLSIDSSGELLHRRGYRQAVAKAPLRETLAAAMLLGSGWRADTDPLLDPLAGSGTIGIEAAMIARRMAPGRDRAFAFQRWGTFDADAWTRTLEAARAGELPSAPAPIHLGDRDAGAVAAAKANAGRAGVGSDLVIEQRALSATPPLPPGGWLVTNPPYGVRVGERGPLRALYVRLGELTAALDGWSLAMLSADRVLEGHVGLPLDERWSSTNGGIPVRLMVAEREGGAPGSDSGV